MNSPEKADGKSAKASGAKRQFCSFHAADRLYGAEILAVKEVTGETAFTPVFHAPPEVRGLVNIRGQISLVLDLRLLLGFEQTQLTQSSRVVLFKPGVGESFGFLVDSVGDVVSAEESMIEWRPENHKSHNSSASQDNPHERLELGVCKLDKTLLVILDPAQALNSLHT